MDDTVKKEVAKHILKASGLGVKSVGYKTIEKLFSMKEISIQFKYHLILDVRRGCILLGLKVGLKRDYIFIDEDIVRDYYENIMLLKYPQQKPELTHYERVKNTSDKNETR